MKRGDIKPDTTPHKGRSRLFHGDQVMKRSEMIAALDQEIARLETARKLLEQATSKMEGKSTKQGKEGAQLKRKLSPEGRKRIAGAMRRKWSKEWAVAKAKAGTGTGPGPKTVATESAAAID